MTEVYNVPGRNTNTDVKISPQQYTLMRIQHMPFHRCSSMAWFSRLKG